MVNMKIAITGTPGTGKTTVAKLLAKKLGFEYIDLNDVIKGNKFISAIDKKRRSQIIDIKSIKKYIKDINSDCVIDSHISHILNVDIIFLLRVDIHILRERMEKKGWEYSKIKENIECEIFNTIKEECIKKRFFEVYNNFSKKTCVNDILWILKSLNFNLDKDFKLSEEVKEMLRVPIGKVYSMNIEDVMEKIKMRRDSRFLYSVGDTSSYFSLKLKLHPNWIFYDGLEKRKKTNYNIEFFSTSVNVKNKRGFLTSDLFNFVKWNVRRHEYMGVFVEGEEDISVLPLILFAHYKALIIYGLFDRTVCVEINKNSRRVALKILKEIMRTN